MLVIFITRKERNMFIEVIDGDFKKKKEKVGLHNEYS